MCVFVNMSIIHKDHFSFTYRYKWNYFIAFLRVLPRLLYHGFSISLRELACLPLKPYLSCSPLLYYTPTLYALHLLPVWAAKTSRLSLPTHVHSWCPFVMLTLRSSFPHSDTVLPTPNLLSFTFQCTLFSFLF